MFRNDSQPGNRLLASLPLGEYALVTAAVERVTLEIGQTLHRSGVMIDHALRHAFPADRRGKISVSVERTADDIILVVKDDGVGLTVTDSGHIGFGTELMKMMTHQIDGELVMDCTSGTCFTLTAPLPLAIDVVQAARAKDPDLFTPQNDR